jgi:hypothetical protein
MARGGQRAGAGRKRKHENGKVVTGSQNELVPKRLHLLLDKAVADKDSLSAKLLIKDLLIIYPDLGKLI